MKYLNKLTVILILTVLSAFAYSSEFLDEYKINITHENIRNVPNGRILGVLRKNAYFNVIKIEGGWFYAQREFYISKSGVRRTGDDIIAEIEAEIENENEIVLGRLNKGTKTRYIGEESDKYFVELKFYVWRESCVPTVDVDLQEAINYYNRARVYRARGRDGIALRYLRRAVELQPEYAQAYFLMGLIYTERYKKTQVDREADAPLINNEFEEAIKNYKKVIAVNPNFPEAYINMGNMYFRITDYEEAILYYDKALAYDSGAVEAMYNKAKAYAQMRDFKNSELAFLKVFETNPNSIEVIFGLAEVYDFSGDLEKAIDLYAKFIEINPQSFVGYYNTACLYARLNKKEEALKFMKQAVEFMPLSGIQNLSKDPDLENIKNEKEFQLIIREAQKRFD